MSRLRLPALLSTLALVLVVAPAAHAADPTPPAATTGSASSIAPTTAKVSGSVDPNNGATTYVFQYGTSSSYGLTTPAQDAGAGAAAVPAAADLANLTSYTRYHYRVVATNAAGITRGADRTFVTARTPKAPTVGTFSAKGVTTTGATPGGSVNAQGLGTTVHVEYGTKTSYGASTAATTLPASFSSKSISFPLAGLTPNTTYHYRAVATNASGVVRGADRTFKTLRAPSGVELDPVVPNVDWKGSAVVRGRVVGAGVGGIGVSVERSDFPFGTTWTARNLTTRSDGSFSTSIGPLFSATKVRVRTRAPYDAASPWSTVANRVTVGLKTAHKTRTAVTLSGRIFPLVPHARATLQRLSTKGTWVRAARAGVKASGRFSSRYRFRVKRPKHTRQFRVVVTPHDGGAHATGTSRTIAVRGRA